LAVGIGATNMRCGRKQHPGPGPYLVDVRGKAVDAGLWEGRAVFPHQLVVHKELRQSFPPPNRID
jgi:hypothetical protein